MGWRGRLVGGAEGRVRGGRVEGGADASGAFCRDGVRRCGRLGFRFLLREPEGNCLAAYIKVLLINT